MTSGNYIHVINPYWDRGVLMFDDESVGLRREPFVAGADDVLKILSGGRERFTLLFSDGPFPGAQAEFHRLEPEHGGTWYEAPSLGMTGWLCPALFKYYAAAPERLYIAIQDQRD